MYRCIDRIFRVFMQEILDPLKIKDVPFSLPQAVYFYQSDSRGPCLAFEGEKLRLHWFRNYLIVVGKEDKTLPRPVQL